MSTGPGTPIPIPSTFCKPLQTVQSKLSICLIILAQTKSGPFSLSVASFTSLYDCPFSSTKRVLTFVPPKSIPI